MSYVGVGYSLNNLICHKLGVVFSSEKILSTAFWIMRGKVCCLFVCLFLARCFGRKHFSSIENTGNHYAFIC